MKQTDRTIIEISPVKTDSVTWHDAREVLPVRGVKIEAMINGETYSGIRVGNNLLSVSGTSVKAYYWDVTIWRYQ